MVQSLIVEPLEPFNRRISVCSGLEIREKLMGPIAVFEKCHPSAHLLSNGRSRQSSVGTETTIVAINATTHRDCAVDVGTSETGVHRDSINLSPEPTFEKAAEGIVAPLVCKMFRHRRVGIHC